VNPHYPAAPRIERRAHPPKDHSLPPVLQKWGLPAVVGVLLLALWFFIILATTVQKIRLLDEGRRELSQLNNVVAQHAGGLLRDAETSMRVIDLWLNANPGADPHDDRRFAALMDELHRASDGLIDLHLVRGDGMMLVQGRQPVDVKDRPFFRARHGGGERRLRIDDPAMNRLTGKWAVPLTWRLEKPVGGIALVAGMLNLDRLIALHEKMAIQPNGTITVVRTDGILLSRAPYERQLIGRSVRDMPAFQTEYGVKERGTFVTGGDLTGTPRLAAYERVPGYPVAVLVARPQADVLEVFNFRRSILWAVAGLITVVALVFTWLMVRSHRALRVAQENLQRLEATDSLTGVMSRRAFLDLAQREFSRARRYDRPAAVLIFDLDHFKRVNDNHGHAAGDMVLRECAAAWKAVLREQDLIGRIGGEEFCAVLPETPLPSALHAAERLRSAVKHLDFSGESNSLKVTVSVGLAMVSKGDDDLGETMERADRALYLAKEAGRDRVEALEAPRPSAVAAHWGAV
jgi:diguanylate cyclase (GGDEF)-like protein